jgi:gliding motility-associated-like protein
VQTDLPADLCAPAPAIELLKTGEVNIDNDNNGCLDGITYTFTVTNIGNVDLQNVILNDDKIGGVVPGPIVDNLNDGILSVGEIWEYQATYNLVQADIDAGFVINNADVSALSVGDNTPVADNQQVQTDLPVDLCAPAPSIGAIKQGQLIDEDVDGCIDSILFTFTVTNTGNVDLQNIVLNDPLLGGDVPGPVNGTDNGGDGILSVGESWSYEATYTLTDIDKGNGVVNNQATVTASSVGDNTPVADLSDDNSLTEDQLTTVVLPVDLCAPMPGLALIKTGTLVDLNADGCNETILYSFRVLNTGGMDLQSIVVTDPLLGGNINGPIANTDEKNDGILSVGESWNYEILYAITQQDIVMGSVTNQATATGASVGDNQDVSDFSDDDSWLEDDPTNTSVPNDVCTLGGATIGLIKTGALADTNNDECPESILYTFSVTNTGEFELTDVQLTDQQLLGGTIAGPVDGTDNGNDGVLSLGETWTYSATYPISEQDVLNGFVTNQATVTANTIGIVASIFDLSDDDSLDENDMTMTSVPDYMCSTDSGSDEPFEIFSGITPNGDGFNDYFRINGIENYPDNVLKIFNRWGALVYESEGYGIGNNLFYGVSEGKATILKEKTLPSGTYFYILTFPNNNPGQASYSGYLYINRN